MQGQRATRLRGEHEIQIEGGPCRPRGRGAGRWGGRAQGVCQSHRPVRGPAVGAGHRPELRLQGCLCRWHSEGLVKKGQAGEPGGPRVTLAVGAGPAWPSQQANCICIPDSQHRRLTLAQGWEPQ